MGAPSRNPLREGAPRTRRVDDALRVEAGRDVEVADLGGLSQAEVRIRREGLGRAEEPGELGVLQRWDAPLRVRADRREVLPIGAELAERPVLGDRAGRAWPPVRLESADHQPAGVVPRVEVAVEPANQRQEVVHPLDRIGRDVDVLGRVERDRHADGRGEVTGPQTAGEDHALRADVPAIGTNAENGPALGEDARHGNALADRHPVVVSALGERERRVAGIHGAVPRLDERTHEPIGRGKGPDVRHLRRFQQVRFDAVMTGDRRGVAELGESALVLRERERPGRPEVHVDTGFLREPSVQVHAVAREFGQRVGTAYASHQARRVPRGARCRSALVRGAGRR